MSKLSTLERCRLCDHPVFQQYEIHCGQEKAAWYHCSCGSLTTSFPRDKAKVYTPEYRAALEARKDPTERYEHLIRTYAPLIEEYVYGRQILDVGYGVPTFMHKMEERGWLCTGIDLSADPEKDKTPCNHIIKGDFETFDFFKEGHDRYDVIWLHDILHSFDNPTAAIYKAYNLLNPNGVLFISTPNAALLRNSHVAGFGHWDPEENRMILTEDVLKGIIGKVDEAPTGKLRTIFCQNNVHGKRYFTWNVMHLIAIKDKIEDDIPMPGLSDDQKGQEAGNAPQSEAKNADPAVAGSPQNG